MNSCQKGKAGEREFAEYLRDNGFEARRGRQYSGSPESPDVVSNLPFHFEVKRVEKLNLEKACDKAEEDAGGKAWIVAHRRNRGRWLATHPMDRVLEMQRTIDKLKADIQLEWNSAINAALEKIPGGCSCDPQQVADEIRSLLS
jgi:Holliday junction resolvase